MSERLEPCPLCQSDNVVEVRNGTSILSNHAQCEDCGCTATMPAWNRRHTPPAEPSLAIVGHAASVAAGMSDAADDEDKSGRTPGDYFRKGYRAAIAAMPSRADILEEAAKVADDYRPGTVAGSIAAAIRAKAKDRT